MGDNLTALQTLLTNGHLLYNQGEGVLELKNLHYNFYTMKTKLVETYGQQVTNT